MSLTIQEHIPLASLTTFRIGGVARYFADVRTESDISEAVQWARDHDTRFVVLSGGSNVLIQGDVLDALVIHIVGNLYGISEGLVDSWTGTNLLNLIQSMGAQGLGGWEKLSGIPGTVGGAVRGNAGAFGSEIKDFVVTVRAYNVTTGEGREFANAECDFSYRHSFFKDHAEWIITRAILRLTTVEPSESRRLVDETITERERRHLQNVQAAGSYFMNPVAPHHIVEMFETEKGVKSRESRVPAGWLIEKAGMKGATVGGAIASLQHPNYIVNTGSATAEDVKRLADTIKAAVQKEFDIALREEAALL
ncbi:UDP-N-acetylmuramate dehydrogenase [Candidatus Kaiserbacteria bacterium]|nr:UDP-N-acetylmuramate dehydrogenase [Candidatus Kaiserbacteria bacterium]